MKKVIVCLLVLSLLLCGCADKTGYDPELLEYPGLTWGMTFEEVQAILGFADADILDSRSGELDPEHPSLPVYHNYSVGDLEMFGFPVSSVELEFQEYTGHEPGLSQIVVYYPDGYAGGPSTDVEALRKVLQEHYGERVMAVPSVRWNYLTGKMYREEYPYTGDDICYWLSGTTARDHLSLKELQSLYDAVTASYEESGYGENLPTFEEYCQCQENPAVMLGLEIEQEADQIAGRHENGKTGLRLFFEAELLVNFRAIDRYFQ